MTFLPQLVLRNDSIKDPTKQRPPSPTTKNRQLTTPSPKELLPSLTISN